MESKELQKLPNVIGHIFQTKMSEGDSLSKKAKNPKTYFCSKAPPEISIKNYLRHLIKHLKTPPAALILMMIYVERFLQSLTNAISGGGSMYPYLLTSCNAHKIIMTALLIAHKYSMDVAYPFSLLSKIVGVSQEELRILESEFLFFVKYELYVSQDLYEKYQDVLTQWPEIPDEEEIAPSVEEGQGSKSTCDDSERKHQREEYKDESEEVRLQVDKVKLSDEEIAQSVYTRVDIDGPNPANPHEKTAVD